MSDAPEAYALLAEVDDVGADMYELGEGLNDIFADNDNSHRFLAESYGPLYLARRVGKDDDADLHVLGEFDNLRDAYWDATDDLAQLAADDGYVIVEEPFTGRLLAERL